MEGAIVNLDEDCFEENRRGDETLERRGDLGKENEDWNLLRYHLLAQGDTLR